MAVNRQGVDPPFAAMSASTSALAQMPASLFWAALAQRVPIRFLMMGVGSYCCRSSESSAIPKGRTLWMVSRRGGGTGTICSDGRRRSTMRSVGRPFSSSQCLLR